MSAPLQDRTIILGITGSIAAYKAADLTSALVKLGAQVHPVLTREAAKLITPLTLSTLARNPAHLDMWDHPAHWNPSHIALADAADLLVIAPATAHTLACLAHGLAPDLLTSLYLATQAPVLLAPAMNGKMLHHPATQANLQTLRDRGHHFVAPATGMLACGYEGEGKLAPVTEIEQAILKLLT